jgi:hypothetical protein
MGCPFLEATDPEVAKDVLKLGMAGWHDNEPAWAKLKNNLLLLAADPGVTSAAVGAVGPDGLTDAQRAIDPDPTHWGHDAFKGPSVDDDHPDRC